jgi:phosphohistidine phosphatase
LLVLRHGQAESAPPGGDDAERPLTASGRRAAAAQARVVATQAVDQVLCSPALRARQTLEALDLDPGVPVNFEPDLFGADVDDLLEQLRQLDDDADDAGGRSAGTVLLVGHNPAVHELVVELAVAGHLSSFRPATLAVLDLDVERWSEAGAGSGRLESLHVPDEQAS